MYTSYRIYLKTKVFSGECVKRVNWAFSIIRFLIENLKLLVHKLFKGIFKWNSSFLGSSRSFIRFQGVYRNGSNLKIQSTLKCKHVDGDLLKNSLIFICRNNRLGALPAIGFFISLRSWLTDCDNKIKASNDLENIFDLRLVLKIADRTKRCVYYSFAKSFDILSVCFGIPRT